MLQESQGSFSKNKKLFQGIFIALCLVSAVLIYFINQQGPTKPDWKKVPLSKGAFEKTVPATARIEPRHKISVNPPASGRIDQILVKEGEHVKAGQLLAWMSSSDRAALMDSARSQGSAELARWKDVYKPTPVIAPVDGQIIQSSFVTGQSIVRDDHLFIISDQLVVRAQVDEADIAQIKIDQEARIMVDAFGGQEFDAKVVQISHSSREENNITVYEVLLDLSNLPPQARSGMTATVDFIVEKKEEAHLLPTWVAQGNENSAAKIFVEDLQGQKAERSIRFGQSNGQFVEVIENIQLGEKVLVQPMNFEDGPQNPLSLLQNKKAQ